MKVLVTGGAGFIGSHLVDALSREGHSVVIVDNLTSGHARYVKSPALLIKKDMQDDLSRELSGTDAVFHLAADPDVRSSSSNPGKSFDLNVVGTFRLLESCRKADVKNIVFASTSTVYGEADVIPTPEDYPCTPISNYGASKMACESYLSSYSASYGMKCTSLRLANIFGERSTHGVMYDFFHKLKKNPEALEILGDGKQDKSYLHVSDCITAILTAWKKQEKQYDVFNVGSMEKTTVDEIATLMCKEMAVSPKFEYTGTPRGWVGDVRLMLLDTSKLERLGWSPETNFRQGVTKYLDWLEGNAHGKA
jgi:UDP-glucose 4-epimerase